MKGFVNWMQGVAVALGGTGLFLIGFLDSSFLSFPMINDLMVIGMVTRHKALLLYYVLMATARLGGGVRRLVLRRAERRRGVPAPSGSRPITSREA